MERETRLELATVCLEGRSSSQLSYSRNIMRGGERRIWTFEAVGGGFTVRRIWPLSNLTVEKYYCSGQALFLKKEKARRKMELVKGVEPPTCWLQISCSSQLSYTSTYKMVVRDRIELSTQGFSILCSTDWAIEPTQIGVRLYKLNY